MCVYARTLAHVSVYVCVEEVVQSWKQNIQTRSGTSLGQQQGNF